MWINIHRHDGLGNALYARAQIYAAALEYKETVIDWGFMNYSQYFPNSKATKLPIYPFDKNGKHKLFPDNLLTNESFLNLIYLIRPRKITGEFYVFWNHYHRVGTPEKARLDNNEFRIFNEKHEKLFLNGHKLRCPHWVEKHRLEICKYFKFPDSYLYKWKNLINNFKKNYKEIIGVHMRRGDFKSSIRGDYYLSPAEYAITLKNKVKADYENSIVILFSEDQFLTSSEWDEVKNAFNFTNITINNGSELDDLCGLMFCDKILGPTVSTFSRWAAYAGNKPWAGIGRNTLKYSEPLDFIKCPIPWSY